MSRPKGLFGWYRQRNVEPINLTNSSRLQNLIRGGNLYLSAQDVIALTLENNLDIEIQRYGPILTREVTRRAQGGGALRTVGAGLAAGPTSVSLTGVSLNASGGGTSVSGVSSTGIVTQLGPAIPNLDPQVSVVTQFSHSTSPQSNTLLTGTTALVSALRSYQGQISKYTDFGSYMQFTISAVTPANTTAPISPSIRSTGRCRLSVHSEPAQRFWATGARAQHSRFEK